MPMRDAVVEREPRDERERCHDERYADDADTDSHEMSHADAERYEARARLEMSEIR